MGVSMIGGSYSVNSYNITKNISVNSDKNIEKAASEKEKNGEIQRESQKLQRIEDKVKMHEMAHMSAGGGLAGSPSFEYQKGPDGRQYIVGGEVPITIKTGKTPEETIMLMEQVKGAALAPADPSSADRAVAAKAAAIAMQASQEMANMSKEINKEKKGISVYA